VLLAWPGTLLGREVADAAGRLQPLDPQGLCSRSDRADLDLTAIGRCMILALASDAPLLAPVRTFDDDVSATQAAAVHWTWSEVAVR